ncbi:11817_t:CDS:2 [Gigaspora rosea]|nr:11817_t:CDS:2 [Gigaspora rosea]
MGATLMKSLSTFPLPEGIGNLLKLYYNRDRALQLLLFNEESLIDKWKPSQLVVYKLLEMTSSHMRVPTELKHINNETTAKGMGLAKSAEKEDPVELDFSLPL